MIPRRTREAEKNVRDEIGEAQNAWQITRLVHRRNETKHRSRTRTALCSHCARVSLRGSVVRHSAERRCRIAIRWRPIKARQIGTTRTTTAPREKIRAAIMPASITPRVLRVNRCVLRGPCPFTSYLRAEAFSMENSLVPRLNKRRY